MHHINSVKIIEPYRVWIEFDDGLQGEVDLSELVGKGVFSAWSDLIHFKKIYVDSETHTLTWPGGIDLCPDSLYEDVISTKIPVQNG